MDFVEYVRVRQERTEAGFGAEQDHAPAVLGAWIVGRIGIAEYSTTQGDELLLFLAF